MFVYAKRMNGTPLNPQPPKNRINIFPVGVFIGILIILLLLSLNYLNIISLSNLFPNQLGWLPHKNQSIPSQQPTSTQNQNYSPNIFQYDTQKAKTILTKYIKDSIKPELLPQTFDIKQGLSIDNSIDESSTHMFGSFIENTNETITINFHYKENTNKPNDYVVFIQPSNIDKTTITTALANTLIASYFTKPYSPIENCNTNGTTSYCETFKIESDGKKGFGAIIAQNASKSPPELTTIVFTCFIPKDSNKYDEMKSCISP